ncbi:MAG TPA: amidohydrolase family protein, partial [Limnochordia bacterium]
METRYKDLALWIETSPLCDTHEHLLSEAEWTARPPDILRDLFDHYIAADLAVAGAPDAVRKALLDPSDPDVARRFAAIQPYWEAVQYTGYGEAVRLAAREVYGLDALTPEGLAAANAQMAERLRPGERLRLLRDVAGLDHVQIDDFRWPCEPDLSGPTFFLYDLSWAGFASGRLDLEALERRTGIAVEDLQTLSAAMERLFEAYGPLAIAVKSQHAYQRTLLWEERSDADAARALAAILADPKGAAEADRLCLGDWALARGVELAIRYNLPFKIHTGYYAGYGRMPIERIRPGHLCALLARYPEARFVLMHTGYPYGGELLALAKHYPNVWVDLCWAWSIDPRATVDFVRRFIHTAPADKLFAFGGDTLSPTVALAYSRQARRWLTRALGAEVEEGDVTEAGAIDLAQRFMQRNQYAC